MSESIVVTVAGEGSETLVVAAQEMAVVPTSGYSHVEPDPDRPEQYHPMEWAIAPPVGCTEYSPRRKSVGQVVPLTPPEGSVPAPDTRVETKRDRQRAKRKQKRRSNG